MSDVEVGCDEWDLGKFLGECCLILSAFLRLQRA